MSTSLSDDVKWLSSSGVWKNRPQAVSLAAVREVLALFMVALKVLKMVVLKVLNEYPGVLLVGMVKEDVCILYLFSTRIFPRASYFKERGLNFF